MSQVDEIKIIWSVLCQKAHIDSRTGLTSLIDVIEQINIDYTGDLKDQDEKPFLFPINSTLASYWQIPREYKNKDIELKIEVVDPKDKILGTTTLKFKTSKNYHKTLVDFPHMLITKPGIYTFKLFISQKKKDKLIKELPLVVNIKKLEK
jgi:hypothetical protein